MKTIILLVIILGYVSGAAIDTGYGPGHGTGYGTVYGTLYGTRYGTGYGTGSAGVQSTNNGYGTGSAGVQSTNNGYYGYTALSSSCNMNTRTGACYQSGCFPPTGKVILKSGVKKMMKDVKIGDKILGRSGAFEPILGFLDKRLGRPTTFITLHTNISSEITLTRSHVIFVQARNGGEQMTKYARDILLGDVLYNEETGTKPEVVEISESIANDYYAPLTDSGTLVVDGFLASCYASYPHWVAHLAMYPARTWPAFFLADVQEGSGAFVNLIKSLGSLVNFRNAAFPSIFMMDPVKMEF